MFTGIVESIGTIINMQKGAQSAALTIRDDAILNNVRTGDSIAVNGVCLTVTNCRTNTFSADVMHETLIRSALGSLRTGNTVNLERALPAGGRFDGHIVSGHIDGTGIITKIARDDTAFWYDIGASAQIMKYIVEKGSIAVDGASLTVANVSSAYFSVSIIPHTLRETVFSGKHIGDRVNLENDIVGKYIEKLFGYSGTEKTQSGITKEFLERAGY